MSLGVAGSAASSAQALNGPCQLVGMALGSTSWTNASGGDYEDPNNWSNGTPGPNCSADISLAGTYTVTTPQGGSAAGITLGASSGTQTLQVAGSTQMNGQPADSLFQPSYSGNPMTIGTHGVLQLTASGINPGSATITGSIVNSGSIRVDPGAAPAYFDIQSNVTNNASGTIAFHASVDTCGCGNTHTWINNGAFTTDAGTSSTFTGTAAGVLFTQSGGTFANNGNVKIGGAFTHTGGSTSGNPVGVCGNVNAPGPGTASVDFIYWTGVCSGGSLIGDIGSGDTVRIHNTSVGGAVSVGMSADVTNNGVFTMDGAAGTGEDQLVGSSTFTNAGTLNLSQAGTSQIQTRLTNTGTVNLDAGETMNLSNVLTQSSGTLGIAAGGTLNASSTVNLAGGVVANSGTFDHTSVNPLSHTGGSTTGNAISVCGGALNATGPGTASFDIAGTASCNGETFGSDVGPGDSVGLHTALSNMDVYAPSAFTNDGSITFASPAGHQVQLHGTAMTNAGKLNFTGPATNMYLALTNQGSMSVVAGGLVGIQGLVTEAAGTLDVDGTLNVSGSLPVTGGTVRGTGTINAPSGVSNTGGTVHPGHSPGILSITGDYTQGVGGTLAVDVAGTALGTGYSRLAVSGNANIAGTLAVTTPSPQTGTFRILTAGMLTGAFSPVHFSGQTDSVAYDGTGVELTGVAPPAIVSPPSISGLAKQGQTLAEAHGSWTPGPTSYTYQWVRCNPAGAGCAAIPGAIAQTYTLTVADVGSTIRVLETAHSAAGASTPASSAHTAVVAPKSPPPDTVAPTVTGFKVTAKKHKRAKTFKFKLSEAASVKIAIAQRRPGRRKGKRCVAPTKKLAHAKRCTRITAKGTLKAASHLGANTISFSGKFGSRTLGVGSYEAKLTATDAAGNKSKAKTITFKVKP